MMPPGVTAAIRLYLKRPAFTLASVLALSLGVGGAVTIYPIFASLQAELPPVSEPARLGTVVAIDASGERRTLPSEIAGILRDQSSVFDRVFIRAGDSAASRSDGASPPLSTVRVSREFFDATGARLARGRAFDPARDGHAGSGAATPGEAVISHSCWQRSFGGRDDVVGRSLPLRGIAAQVVGVAARDFWFGGEGVDVWLLIDEHEPRDVVINVRLREGETWARASAELAAIGRRIISTRTDLLDKAALRAVTLAEDVERQRRGGALLLYGPAGLLLAIAAINIAAVLLAMGLARRGEFAVRAALGASRLRLAGAMMGEAALLAIPGTILGLALGLAGLSWFKAAAVVALGSDRGIHADPAVLVVAGLTALLAAAAAGAGPALVSSKIDLAGALNRQARTQAGGGRAYSANDLFVVFEVALAVGLVVGAVMISRFFSRLEAGALGAVAARTVVAHLDGPAAGTTDLAAAGRALRALAEVRAAPGVAAAALSDSLPVFVPSRRGVSATPLGPAGGERRLVTATVQVMRATSGLIDVMGVPLLAGRDLGERPADETRPEALITEGAARHLFGGATAVGGVLRLSGGGRQPMDVVVAGVIREVVRGDPMLGDVTDVVLVQRTSRDGGRASVVARTSGPASGSIAAIESAIGRSNPEVVTKAETLEAAVRRPLAGSRLISTLLSIFALLCLVLACVGMFSVTTLSATGRLREFAVRLSLGASPIAVTALLGSRLLAEAAIGAAAGCAVSFAIAWTTWRALAIASAKDPVLWAMAGGAVLVAVLLAGLGPARRVATLQPATLLGAD